MNDQLEMIPGSTRDHGLSQFFTPPKLAAKVVEWAGANHKVPEWADLSGAPRNVVERFDRPMRVLEPSAGNGAIVRELVKAGAEVTAVEIDPRFRGALRALEPYDIRVQDFLNEDVNRPLQPNSFDLCVGNFPFHLDLTGEFTLHALKFCPRVCAIYPANFFYSEQREKFWKQVRPTRTAYIAKRPWPGATDYVALDLQKRPSFHYLKDEERSVAVQCTIEHWNQSWT